MLSLSNALGCLLLTAALGAAPARAAESVTILAGGASGAYHALAVALADVLDTAMPGIKTSVQATKSSDENLALLQAARGEIAFALGDSVSSAWKGNGEGGFKAPHAKLRGIAALYPNYIQIVARADSDIKSLADLKGKNVSVGASGSDTERNARTILAAAGLSYKDFAKVEHLPFGESVELMKSRQLDATLQSAGLGVSAMRDVATSVDIVVVPIPPDVIRKTRNPAYLPATIPANTYRGQTADVPAAAVRNYLVTREGVSEAVAYGMTKALWTSLPRLVGAHSAAQAIDIERALDGMPVPLHAGARKYYREVGILK